MAASGSSNAHAESHLEQSKDQVQRAYQKVYEESKKAKTPEERRAIRDRVMAPALNDLQVQLNQDSREQLSRIEARKRSKLKASQDRLGQVFAQQKPQSPLVEESLDGTGIAKQVEFKK